MRKIGKVINIQKNKVYVVTKENEFVVVKQNKIKPIVGQMYAGEVYSKSSYFKKVLFITSLFVLIMIIAQTSIYFKSNMNIIVHMNAKFKISMNKWSKVIKVEGVNEKGRTVLANTKIRNKSINDSLNLLLTKTIKKGYINKDYLKSNGSVTIYITENPQHKKLDISTFKMKLQNEDLKLLINNNGEGSID